MPSRNTTRRSDIGRSWTTLIALVVIAAVLAWSASTRPMGNDEGIWSYAARAWVDHGVPPYDGTVENKPPGPFLVFALQHVLTGDSVVLPRALGILAMLVACDVVRRLAERWGGATAGLAAMLAAGGAFAWNGLDGPYTAAVESFQVGFTALSVGAALAIVPGPRAWRGALWAGLCAGAALLFKQTALAGCAAGGVTVLLQMRRAPARDRAVAMVTFGAGVVAAHGVGVAIMLVGGSTLNGYFECVWGLLVDPASRDAGAPGTTWLVRLATAACRPLFVLAAAPIALVMFRRRLADAGVPVTALLVWCALEGAAALAAGTFWGHQFKPTVAPCAVALGLVIGAAAAWQPRSGVVLTALVVVGLFPQDVAFDRYAGLARRRGVSDSHAASAIAAIVAPGERVTIASRSANPVLAQCGRLASSRRANLLFTAAPTARSEFLVGASAARRIFVPLRDLDTTPAWLAARLETGWVRRDDVAGFALFVAR